MLLLLSSATLKFRFEVGGVIGGELLLFAFGDVGTDVLGVNRTLLRRGLCRLVGRWSSLRLLSRFRFPRLRLCDAHLAASLAAEPLVLCSEIVLVALILLALLLTILPEVCACFAHPLVNFVDLAALQSRDALLSLKPIGGAGVSDHVALARLAPLADLPVDARARLFGGGRLERQGSRSGLKALNLHDPGEVVWILTGDLASTLEVDEPRRGAQFEPALQLEASCWTG